MKKLYKIFFSWENALIAVLILAIAISFSAIAFEATEGDLKISVFIGILTFVICFIWFGITEYYGQIQRAVQIAHTENLEPIEENKVNELISKNVYLHGPAIETFYEE